MIGPAWLDSAYHELRAGVREIPGPEHNPRIVEYMRIAGAHWVTDDETAWCGGFAGFCIVQAGLKPPALSVRARAWLQWGTGLHPQHPAFGAITVLTSGPDPQPGPEVIDAPGHVSFFWGHGHPGSILVIGGNQGNAVTIAAYSVHRLLGYRWPTGR